MAALLESLLLELHRTGGNWVFIPLMISVALLLSLRLIPITTDIMVNSAAGLAGKHWGRQYRTLVINCSTNNPEIATMFIALFFFKDAKRLGGIGTPLGSNFANIYLIFVIALGWVLTRMWLQDRSKFRLMIGLLRKERRLLAWHFLISFGMFLAACCAFRLLTGQFPIGPGADKAAVPSTIQLCLAAGICLAGVAFFMWRDTALRSARPELFEDINDECHSESWASFAIGTAGLILSCYLINVMFSVAETLYSTTLSRILGAAVFAVLHYFLGALVTSLPEMNVALSNYRRAEAADLNTAFASASASNMSNLAIASIGCLAGVI